MNKGHTAWWVGAILVTAGFLTFGHSAVGQGQEGGADRVRPTYDTEGALLLPADFRTWALVGSSLGMSYSEGSSNGNEMFHHTLMEPTAYAYYLEHGEFRDGTMLALLLHPTGEGVLPSRRGRFANSLASVEMAVKDRERSNEEWAYYGFGTQDGLRATARAFGRESCYNCHAEHAAQDNVFTQFYPLLVNAAQTTTTGRADDGEEPLATEETEEDPVEKSVEDLVVAIEGLDPILLLDEGREELGKPEIVEDHGAFRYQFVSEPNRQRFAANPTRYAFQNETCPVVPGARVFSNLYTVHAGKLYAFATEGCIAEFQRDPASYLPLSPLSEEP